MNEPPKLQRMAAEIIFENPAAAARAMPALIDHDFEVHNLFDEIDPCGTSAVWWLVWRIERDEVGFFNLVNNLIEPFGGWVEQAGSASDDEMKAWTERGRGDHLWPASERVQ
jgi:hypothetical protein